MTKQNNLQSLFCGILFCLSITALVIACLAFTKKGGGTGEYFELQHHSKHSCQPNKNGKCAEPVCGKCCNQFVAADKCNDCVKKYCSPKPTPKPTPKPFPTPSPTMRPWIPPPNRFGTPTPMPVHVV